MYVNAPEENEMHTNTEENKIYQNLIIPLSVTIGRDFSFLGVIGEESRI